jgi:hypothetical protein
MKKIIYIITMLYAPVAAGQVFSIPNTAIPVFDTVVTLQGSRTYWLCSGSAALSCGAGSCTFFIEEGCYYRMVNAGSNTFYVKASSELHAVGGGGENKIYYETGALIIDSLTGGWGNAFIECQDLIFDYYDSPKEGCLNPSGINSGTFDRVSVYPNPVLDILHIRFPEQTVKLLSYTGQILHEGTGDIDMSTYPAGVYIIVIDGKAMKILKH